MNVGSDVIDQCKADDKSIEHMIEAVMVATGAKHDDVLMFVNFKLEEAT